MTDTTHLTEDDRQSLADGTLPPEHLPAVDAHLRSCATCAADVARIKTLMSRVHDVPAPSASLDDLWPSIRARIEQSKVVPLATSGGASSIGRRNARLAWLVGSFATLAAALVIAVVALADRRGQTRPSDSAPPNDATVSLIAAADSAHVYEEEAQTLLNKLELQRAMLRPEAAEALDRDLHVVDVAIAELKDAIARDPSNRALRQLLASSYRQKVDLLKRVANAS